MKFLKRLFYGICILIMVGCGAVLFCALNPSVTDSLAEALYAGSREPGRAEGAEPTEPAESKEPVQPEEPGLDEDAESGLLEGNVLYEIPADGVVTLPEGLDGRTGYQPVWEEQEQVAADEANSIKNSLGTGETGEELAFDPEIYPYYAMLEPAMQKLYKQIYANALAGTYSFAPVVKVNVSQLKNVFEAVYNDHPELFWLETGYSCKHLKDGQCVEITMRYYTITNDLKTAKAEFEGRAYTIVKGASELESDFEKERYVHNALLSLAEYDKNADMNQSAYSALVNGRSVCAGYARAFQYLMQQLGIPCYYCTGYSGEEHAWNIVRLSDGYYNVDVTWDDTVPATYDYFNRSDKEFGKTHVRKGLSVYLPACKGGNYGGRATGTPFEVEMSEDIEPVASTKPMEPLTYEEKVTEADKEAEALKQAGVKKEEVIDSIEAYYADCLTRMTQAGSGQQQFTNVVPEYLWIVIEREYTEGRYQKGYVEKGLEELDMDNFAIQLQAQKLGGGYYRLYHNIATWN
ncbi:MAG: hypothetical protein J6C84_06345 [Lachnospiraceae bacterium]|nr:hypothetical protein [Lachnospiraceae bacterium]